MKKNLIITFLVMLFIQCAVFAETVKFIQVTDVHYRSDDEYRAKVLDSAVKTINKEKGISFVMFTGDNIDRPNEKALKEFIRKANKLKFPYYILIGNHDVYKNGGLSKDRYLEVARNNCFRFHQRKPNYVFKKNGFVFIVADGAKEVIPGAIGYFKEDTMKWLTKQLNKYKRRSVVIFQHYPLIMVKDSNSHRVYNKDEYLELLDKQDNVVSVIAGHIHTNGEIMRNGVYHITSPSLLNDPHSYKVITISRTRGFSPMVYTELKPVEMSQK
ncbi:metallophosphoesterase [bacterium]|nr:metallophosphoesterase [bacterium]